MAGIKIIAKNRRAYFEYNITEKYEAGIVLQGTEVKSIRSGKVSLGEGWVDVDANYEVLLKQVHVSHYKFGNIFNHEEQRPRKLLLKKKQIYKLAESIQSKGFSVIPLKVYAKNQLIKVEIGLGKGKKLHDKRESGKAKDAQRDIERALKIKV